MTHNQVVLRGQKKEKKKKPILNQVFDFQTTLCVTMYL